MFALRDTLGDHKARFFQRVKHVLKNGLNGVHPLHLFERVFEAGLGGVPVVHFRQAAWGELFKPGNQRIHERG